MHESGSNDDERGHTSTPSVATITTTNVRHTSPNHTWLNGGWIEEFSTSLPLPKGNPVASGVVVLIIQLARDTLDTEERRRAWCVQHVMFPFAKDQDSMGRAVFFCSTKRRHCLTRVVLRHRANKCQSAHTATDVLHHPAVPLTCLLGLWEGQ